MVTETTMYLFSFWVIRFAIYCMIHYIEGEAVSEEENSGDEEDLDALHKEADTENTKAGKRKRKTQKEFAARYSHLKTL